VNLFLQDDFEGFAEDDLKTTVRNLDVLELTIKSLQELVTNPPKQSPLVRRLPILLRKSQTRQYIYKKCRPNQNTMSPGQITSADSDYSMQEKKSMKGTIKVRLLVGGGGLPVEIANGRSRSKKLPVLSSVIKTVRSKVSEGLANKLKQRSLKNNNTQDENLRGANKGLESNKGYHMKNKLKVKLFQSLRTGRFWKNRPNKSDQLVQKKPNPIGTGKGYVTISPLEALELKVPELDAPLIVDGKRPRKPKQSLAEYRQGERDTGLSETFVDYYESEDDDDDKKSGQASSDDEYEPSFSEDESRTTKNPLVPQGKKNFARRKIDEAKRFISVRSLAVSSAGIKKSKSVLVPEAKHSRPYSKTACCVCLSTLRLRNHYKCSQMICPNCARFYKETTTLFANSKARYMCRGMPLSLCICVCGISVV